MADEAQADEIAIWQIPLGLPGAGLHELLSPDEQTRAARFVFARDRHHFTVGHAALRAILAQRLDVTPRDLTFRAGPHGKPQLVAGRLHFNLTHAGSIALLALSPIRQLGIDLEPVRAMPDALDLAAHFHPNELAGLRATPPNPRAFFECWTRKEAFVKATGQGLGTPLDSFEVTFYPEAARLVDQPGWLLFNLDVPGYAAALVAQAIPGAALPELRFHTWHPDMLTGTRPC